MAQTEAGSVLRYLRGLAVSGTTGSLTDRELLERFVTDRDEAAFAALVKRHARLVWGICRRTLGHAQDAEDAFQASFLVLACRAGSLHKVQSVAGWLHGVAHRTAMNTKRKAARRRAHERRVAGSRRTAATAEAGLQELQALLDEEVQLLPAANRAVFVLCCLEGKGLAEAARELGKTEGATATALTRARQRLRQRLARRGVALGAALTAAALAPPGASAAAPAPLLASTIRAATRAAAQPALTAGVVSDQVAALVKGILLTMSKGKLHLLTASVVLAGALAAAAAWLSGPAQAARRPQDPPRAAARTGDAGARAKAPARPIAWGKAVAGLQAGLRVAHDRHDYRAGEAVKFTVWVRNVGEKPAKLVYRAGWFSTSRPAVLDGEGKPLQVVAPSAPESEPLVALALKAGETAELGPAELVIEPADGKGTADRPTVRPKAGTYKVRYGGLSTNHPALATGHAEITVRRGGAARKEERKPLSATAKRFLGSWQGPDGGAGPTYRADGTGRNPDGSPFEWRVEGDFLVARKLPVKGERGDWWRAVVLFSRDAKEYQLLLDKPYTFRRLLPDGERDAERTKEGRSYPRTFVTPEDQGDGPAPQVQPPSRPAAGAGSPAGDAVIRIGPNVHVSKANAEILHAEVVLAADPTDARRLVAASMYSPPPVDPANPKVVVYASGDGGRSWAPTLERKDAHLADPAFAWGAGDSLFFVSMWAPSLARLTDAGCLHVARSRDGGRTWGPTTTIGAYHDRPFLALDSTGGKFRGRLYCLTHKGLLVSTDAGKSFGRLRSWARRPGSVPVGSGNPVVLSDGTLVVLYNNGRNPEIDPSKKRDPYQDQRGYLAVRTSRDGGDSFSDERVLAERRAGLPPMAAAAPAGTPWQDRVHVVWQEVLPAGRRCVKYAHSKDRGTTFSKPVLLSEQYEAKSGHEAFLPSVAVNKDGVVAVSWYDTRELPPGQTGWDVRFRASRDGGETWGPSVRVTEASTQTSRKTRKALGGVGHTAGLAADAGGVFHCLWVDGRSGVGQVWTAAVTVRAPE